MDDPCKNCALVKKRDAFLRTRPGQIFETSKESKTETHRRQSDDTPQTTQALITAIIESSSDCITVWDKHDNCLYINQTALDYVNITRGFENIRDALAHLPDFFDLWINRIHSVFQSGKPAHFADTLTIDTRIVHGKSILSPIRSADGDIIAVSIVYRDVTEEKKLEQELAESERRYRELYDHARIPLYRSRLSDGKLLECNNAFSELLGYDDKRRCLELYTTEAHYADLSRRAELLEALHTENEVNGFEIELVLRNGTRGWFEVTAKEYPDQGYIEGALFDITAAKVLTAAEKEVLAVVMQGKSNKEIAKCLNRSVRTIEDHRAHIMQKLGAENLVELAQKALSATAVGQHKNK